MVVDAYAEHPDQINLSPYAYVANNPIDKTDPDGNCPGPPCNIKLPATPAAKPDAAATKKPSTFRQKSIAKAAFPTVNQNVNVEVKVSAGYKGMSQSTTVPTGSETGNKGPNVVYQNTTDNTTSVLAVSGGTVTNTKVIATVGDIHDASGKVIGTNMPIVSIVQEKVESFQIGPFSIQTREVSNNGVREVYQGREGVEFEKGVDKKIGGNFSVGASASATLQTNWFDVK